MPGSVVELLPSHSRTEGFNPDVVRLFNNRLELRKATLLHTLYNLLQAASDSAATGSKAAQQLLDGRESLEGNSHQSVLQLAAEHGHVSTEWEAAQEALQTLQQKAALQAQLASFDQLLAAGLLKDAAETAADFRVNWDAAHSAEAAEAQGACQLRLQHLRQALEQSIATGITFGASHEMIVRVDAAFNPSQIWPAAASLTCLQEHLHHVVHRLLAEFLQPLTAPVRPLHTVVREKQQAGASVLECDRSSDSGDSSSSSSGIEDSLAVCLQFLANYVFQGVTQQGGALLWPELASMYLQHGLQPACKAASTNASAIHRMMAAAEALENQACELGFCSNTQPGPIHAFCCQITRAAVQHERMAVVLQARDIIVSADYDFVSIGTQLPHDPEAAPSGGAAASSEPGAAGDSLPADAALNWGPEGSEGPLLASGQYCISRSAQSLLALMRATMARACQSTDASLTESLLGAVVDAAALKAQLPSQVHPRQLRVPHLAALYHMDCQHLAQELLLMPYCYSCSAGSASSSFSILVAAALQLRQAGHACLHAMEQQQVTELREVLQGAHGFRKLHEAQAGIAARRAVARCMHLLTRLGKAVGSTLSPHAYAALAGALVNTVAGEVAGSIVSMHDIGSDESEDLAQIIAPLVTDAVSAALGSPTTHHLADAHAAALAAAVQQSAPQLAKLQVVQAVLTARMSEIRAWWRAGRLQKAGLSLEESRRMIRALFQDTDLRRATLQELQ